MADDDIHEPTRAQSTTSSIPLYTLQVASTFADTASQYEQTSLISLNRPRSEDLPPSHGSASGDASSSGTVMSFGPREFHPFDINGWLSYNEWPNEPPILEYQMRGQGRELPPEREEGQVSDDDHAGTQAVIVRQGDIVTFPGSPPPRDSSVIQEPPHSLPVTQTRAMSERRQERSARGPFGRVGQRVGNWGQQVGQRFAIGHQFRLHTEGWASAYSAGGGGYNPPVRPTRAVRPGTADPSAPPQYEHPPPYEDTRADL
jgi:hypothetical protein